MVPIVLPECAGTGPPQILGAALADYVAPKITELGSLVDLTKGSLGEGGNDFAFAQVLGRTVEAGVGDSISY